MAPPNLTTLSSFFIGVLLSCSLTLGVDRNNFKTCEQSSFCRRLRSIKPEDSNYALDLTSLQVSDSSVETGLRNKDADVVLKFKLTALVDDTFRVTVDEVEPLHPRYKVEGALQHEPSVASLRLKDRTNTQATLVTGSGDTRVVLHSDPFRVEFYRGDTLFAVVNGKNRFAFEHLRPKQGTNAEDDNVVDLGDGAPQEQHEKAKEDPGAWEENFKSHHDSKPRGPEGIAVDVSFLGAHRAYGLPEHGDRLSLRTTEGSSIDPYRLYNLDVFEYELDTTMALYGSVPVLYAIGPHRHTSGVFWHNAAETWVDISNSKDANVVSSIVNLVSGQRTETRVDARFISESGIVDLFVMLGPTLRDVTRQYVVLTGVAPLPQYFTLAYHQSRWNYNDEDDVRTVVERFDADDLPLDVMWLDIEYTDGKKYFTWDSLKFRHPQDMVNNLTATGRKLVIIIDPHIKREGGYFLHEDALANGYYVKNKDGNVYEGWCWPGSSSYLDFFEPRIRQYYSGLYALDKFTGTTRDVYIWNDMNEPSVFNGPEITMNKDCIHYGGWEHRHVHNVYGLFHTMATYEGLLARSGNSLRPFILTRAHFAGTQRYSAIWTGDNMAEWSHLVASIPMCLSEALAGISFCGADIGGFFNNPDEELLQRWYQLGAWLPFYRAHAHIDTKRREPFLYSDDVRTRIRTSLRQRYAHLPYWYTAFRDHSVTGEPVIRPLSYQYPDETETYDIDNQLLIGNAIMVRPVTDSKASSVDVYFPAGENWYDVDTFSEVVGQGRYVTVPVTLDSVPVYYRAGSIVPRKDRPRRASTLTHDDPYTLYVVPDTKNYAQGSLYIDDYESFAYRNKEYLHVRFVYKDGVLKVSPVEDGPVRYETRAWIERIVVLAPPSKVTGAKLTVDKKTSTDLETSYDAQERSLIVRKPGVSVMESFTVSLLR